VWAWPRHRAEAVVASSLQLLACLSLGLRADAAHAVPATTVLLAVRLNGVEQPDGIEALRRGDALELPVEAWDALKLKPPTGAPTLHGGRAFRALSDPRLTWQIDAPSQTLWIDAPAAAFVGGSVQTAAAQAPEPLAAGVGGYANYELQWQRGTRSGETSTNALIEAASFGHFGSFRSTGLWRHDARVSTLTRLDTAWVHEDPQRLATLTVGDAISLPGDWGRALRFAGLQWSTDFSLRPGFQSFPLPSLQGEAALPSAVDVYVDNSRRVQGQVGAGAFDLKELPVVTGEGEVRMVVRDLLGREQVVVQRYYASPLLLRAGLSARSFEVGALREDYGLASARYGRGVATATDRLGVSDSFTRELRAEVAGRQLTAGASGVWLWPAFGTLQFGAIGSHAPRGDGAMLTAAAQRQARDWSGSLQWRRASRDFVQLGQADGSAPRSHVAAAVGRAWQGFGFGASVVRRSDWQGAHQQIVAGNVSRSLGRAGSLAFVLLRDTVNRQTTASLVWSLALDGRDSMTLAATRQQGSARDGSGASASWQRPPPDGNGLGLRLDVEGGAVRRSAAQAVWQTDAAVFNAGLAESGGRAQWRGGVGGSVAWLGDSVFVGRRIDDSFAVVDVGGYAGVGVLHENRRVATTDARGRAFVGGLRGHEVNRIGVDPGDLPVDAQVQSLENLVVPPARSGVAVAMPLRRSRVARFRLVDGAGVALPAGSEFRLAGRNTSFPIGYEGRAFAADLDERNELVARWPGHECRVRFELPPTDDGLPDLGTLSCR